MQFEPTAALSVFDHIVDTKWWTVLNHTQLSAVLYLLRHGYVGTRGLPSQAVPDLAEAIGKSVDYTLKMLRAMVKFGSLVRVTNGEESGCALNPDWQPYRPR